MEARRLDLALAGAWATLELEAIGPWRLRAAAGVTGRANSVLPLGTGPDPTTAELEGWLDAAETWYARRGLPPRIQLIPSAWPPSLRDVLMQRGYEEVVPTLLLTGPLPSREHATWHVQLAAAPNADWIEVWWTVDPRGADPELETARRILAAIEAPRAFASVVDGGVPVGVALGVLVDRVLVIECLATRAERRRQGVATTAIEALAAWAHARGAEKIALAVVEQNAQALALYERLGLEIVGRYTYARLGTTGS
jgi:ribosomal protein S18 acetylase RimI-like enzyme